VHGIVSGIQRVVIESWKELQTREGLKLTPVAFAPKLNAFIELDAGEFQKILSLLTNTDSVYEVRALAQKIVDKIPRAKEANFELNDVLLSMGAAWAHPTFFSSVSSLKLRGIKVVSLSYDLIPGLDDSFPYSTKEPFLIYLNSLVRVSDRIPCISMATRDDLEAYAASNNFSCPPGIATKLPGGLPAANQYEISDRILEENNIADRPYVLIVGTVEARKQHIVALKAWAKMVREFGVDKVPNLVCVGRWGWNIRELIDEWNIQLEARPRIHFLTSNLSDSDLASLYSNALFTVYPSRKEGWGLPISESLDFGKVPVIANVSSLPEAGEGFAIMFEEGNHLELAGICMKLYQDSSYRESLEKEILNKRQSFTWNDFATAIEFEIFEARKLNQINTLPRLEFGREYGLISMSDLDVDHSGKSYLHALSIRRKLPFTGQISTIPHHSDALLCIDGNFDGLTEFGMQFDVEKSHANIQISFDQGEPCTVLISIYCDDAKSITVEEGGKIVESSKNGVAVLAQVKPNKDSCAFVSISSKSLKKVFVTSFLVFQTGNATMENELGSALVNFSSNNNLYLKRNMPISESEFIKNSISWKLTKPVRVLHRKLLKLLKK
jgi:glycosyltransferase involved in cell wall biosynthesis